MTAEQEQKQTVPGKLAMPVWYVRLRQFEIANLIAYALSLPISISASNALLIVGLVLLGAEILAARLCRLQNHTGAIEQDAVLPPLTIPILAFASAVTISGAFNGGDRPGQIGSHSISEALNSLVSLKTLLPYFWAYFVFKESRAASCFCVISLLWLTAAAGLWGTIQQVFDIHFGYKYLQGTGFLAHPMAYAGQMQIFCMLSLGLLLSKGYENISQAHPFIWTFPKAVLAVSEKTPIFVAVVLANLAGLVFAGERSAWIGGIAGILAIAALKSWKTAAKAVGGLMVLGGISWLCIPLIRVRIASFFSGHDLSVTVRQRIWGECFEKYIPQSPIFGIGWNKFPHFDIPEAIVPGVSKDINHAHSNYVQILTTTGVVGLLGYVFLVICTLKTACTKFHSALNSKDQFEAGIALGIFGAATSLAVAGLFEYNFGTAQVRLAQWFVFGLL